MAARGTESKKAKAAKIGKKGKSMKKSSKLPGFVSFSNKKFVIMLVLIVAVASVGSYKVYQSSAATTYKPKTISLCRNNLQPLRIGSERWGDDYRLCVRYLQNILQNVLVVDNALARHYWTGLKTGVDGIFGPDTYQAAIGYQRYMNYIHRDDTGRKVLDEDGIVGPQTWARLQEESCPLLSRKGVHLDECGSYGR